MLNSERVKYLGECEKIEKPWGYEVIWTKTENYVAKMMYILPEKRMSLQYHAKKEETIYVMRGELCVWESEDDNEFQMVNHGHIYHVKPGEVHRFGAKSSPVMLMEVSTNHLEDVVRIADDFDR